LGEVYRVFAQAVETKQRNRSVDRLAREGEYDWSLLPTLGRELILSPLRQYADKEFAELIERFMQSQHQSYLRLVSTVCLDSLRRDEVLPLLIEKHFSLRGADLILSIKREFGGPDLMDFLDSECHPISVVLNWADEGGAAQLAKTAFPGTTGVEKTNRDMVTRWARADQLPDLINIKNFADALAKHGSPAQKEKVPNLRRWLIAARAITWLEQNAVQVPIRETMHRHLSLCLPDLDITSVLQKAVLEAGARISPLKMPALTLYENLKRAAPKNEGDQTKTKRDLDEFERLTSTLDPEGKTLFHLEWLKGRWQVLSGNYKEALPHYQRATALANYRAGGNQRLLVEEAFVLASFLGNKTYLKQLKNWAIAFHLFQNPSGDNVVEGWEIEHWRQQFHFVFPVIGHFTEALVEEKLTEQLPFLVLSKDEAENKKADLRNPNRVFSIPSLDGQTRRWPQLRFFASIGRVNEVRSLLEKGAAVDQLDESGGSALLCAIQHATNTGEREILDLLLRQNHDEETLNKATNKKQLTPLLCAIEYGAPDVVERLLEMGATADRRGNIVNETPLYLCIAKLGFIRNPVKLYQYIFQNLSAKPDLVQREVMRRYNVNLAGVFGDGRGLEAMMENPEHRNNIEKLVTAFAKIEVSRHSIQKLVRIAELLLKHKANPNAQHQYPEPGRTPLMLAAENNSGLAFDTLMKSGGDPYRMDVAGMDCRKIAYGFAADEVVGYLRARGCM
jgi:ankyrin repeat protein/tetratricopeptide (TPR) repeat protein